MKTTRESQQSALKTRNHNDNSFNFQIDLSALKKSQDFIFYKNSYTSRNFNKNPLTISSNLFSNTPPNQLPKMSKLISPISKGYFHQKSISQIDFDRSQKIFPDIRHSSNDPKSMERNESVNSQLQNVKVCKEVQQLRDKISRNTFMPRYSQQESQKIQKVSEWNPLESYRSSRSNLNKLNSEELTGTEIEMVNQQKVQLGCFQNIQQEEQGLQFTESPQKVQKESDIISQTILQKNQQKIQFKHQNQIKRHSMDDRIGKISAQKSNSSRSHFYQNVQKYKKIDVDGMGQQLDFNQYCKLKLQSQQINGQEQQGINLNPKINSSSIQMVNSTTNNNSKRIVINQAESYAKMLANQQLASNQLFEQNLIQQIPQLHKKMVETISLQNQAKQVYEKNSLSKISQLLDLPYYKWKRDGNFNSETHRNQHKHQKSNLEQSQFKNNQCNCDQIKKQINDNEPAAKQLLENNSNFKFKNNSPFNDIKVSIQQQPQTTHLLKSDKQLNFPQFKVKIQLPNRLQHQQIPTNSPKANESITKLISKTHRFSNGDIKSDNYFQAEVDKSNCSQNDSINGLKQIRLEQLQQQQNQQQLQTPIPQKHQEISINNKIIEIQNYPLNIQTNSVLEPQKQSPLKQSSEHTKNDKITTNNLENSILTPIQLPQSPDKVLNLSQYNRQSHYNNVISLENPIQKQPYNNNLTRPITPENKVQQVDVANLQNKLLIPFTQYESQEVFRDKQQSISKNVQNSINIGNNNGESSNNNSLSQQQTNTNSQQTSNTNINLNQKWKLNHQYDQKNKQSIKQFSDQMRRSSQLLQIQTPNQCNSEHENEDQGSLSNSIDDQIRSSRYSSSEKKRKSISQNIRQNSLSIGGQLSSQTSILSVESNNQRLEEKLFIRDQKNPLQNQVEVLGNKELQNDPLLKDYSNVEIARSQKKKHSFSYSLQKQTIMLSLGSQKLIKEKQNQNDSPVNTPSQGNSTTTAQQKSQRRSSMSSMNFQPFENKSQKSSSYISSNQNLSAAGEDHSKSHSSINNPQQNQQSRRQSVIKIIPASEDLPFRAVKSERKIQVQQQRDQQLEQIHQARRTRKRRSSLAQIGEVQNQNSNYRLEVVQMSLIQEIDDEMYSPQPLYQQERKRTQTLFVPQLQIIESSSPSSSQLGSSPDCKNSPSKKKLMTERNLNKYTNLIRNDLINYFTNTLVLTSSREQIAQYTKICIELIELSTAPVISSVNKNKYFMFTEGNLRTIGEFVRDKFLQYGFDLQQVLFFHKKFNFLVAKMFNKSLLDQIENCCTLSELIEQTLTKLADKIIFLKSYDAKDIDNLKNALNALLSDSKDILLYYLDMYKPYIQLSPIDFSMLKLTVYDILKQKQIPQDLSFSIIEKIEKVRNYLFPNYQFSDTNFRKNIALLLYYIEINQIHFVIQQNKVIGGYFIDPSMTNIQEFIHSLWNCLYGLNSLEKFAEGLKNQLKIQLNIKFFDLLFDFLVENASKFLTAELIDDLKYKFFKLKQITNSQQLIPTIASIDIDTVLETVKEINLIKAVNKQTPLDLVETKIFDYSFLQMFLEFAVKSNKEVLSVFESNIIKISMQTDIETIQYQFEILKQALNNLNIEQNFIDEITFLYNLLLIKQIAK